MPHGFDDFQSFQEFAGGFRNRMRERYPDLEMGFQGSSVTGRSADTGDPFDQGRRSDFDVAISGDSLYATARERGVSFRGDGVSTGPLTAEDVRALDLRDESGDYLQLPDFPDVHYLLFVDEAARPDEVRSRLAGLPQWRFLRRRELD